MGGITGTLPPMYSLYTYTKDNICLYIYTYIHICICIYIYICFVYLFLTSCPFGRIPGVLKKGTPLGLRRAGFGGSQLQGPRDLGRGGPKSQAFFWGLGF